MIQHLLNLPYVTYWLPITVAVVVAAPLLMLMRPRASALAAARAKAVADLDAQSVASSDQRKSFRRGGNCIGILYKHTDSQDVPQHASVVDRSLGGLCLMMQVTLPTGTLLSVRPVGAEEIVPWVEIEVCTCRRCDDAYEVGCRFVKVPPYSILLLFG